ncbi:hypothetical protein Zmor_018205 [Zophobas morio]|uniref:Peptidase A2 domain-containing protein n=1 Tax=Zophobas morio TaxID=2755281 RepID=A0AA38MDB8_9CUCU|nr:hypothetical protein Zmor_018205 [Zophobas morio]
MEKLLEKVLSQIDDLIRRLKNDISRKQSMECYRDGRQGRLKRDCRARLPAPRRNTQRRSHRDVKGAITLGNGFTGENKATSEVKIRSFTKDNGSTVSGKIYENPAAITIDTGAEVSIVRNGLVRAEDVEVIPETIRLKTVIGESTLIMGEAEVEICVGQLKISHRVLVANMEDDFILGMDLISRRGLTIDPMKKVLRLGNEDFELNQRCIEAKPARLVAYQNCRHYDEAEQPKARSNRRKKAVVEDDQWTTARCRKDQEENKDIGPLLRWKEDGMDRPGWSEVSGESPSFKTLWAQWDSLRV